MKSFAQDRSGAAALEFAITAPVFIAFLIAIVTVGLAVYAQLALQHSVEMAARCASVDTSVCGTTTQIQQYAMTESYGLSPSASVFTVSAPTCGNMVQANYPVTLNFGPAGSRTVTLTAKSCFPK